MTCATKINFSIDRGGTFTDVFAEFQQPPYSMVLKLLSQDPMNYPDAPREGIRQLLERITGQPHPRHLPLDTSRIGNIRMGTTVATNALLERNGAACAFITTKGFKDLLFIGNQSRQHIFDLNVQKPDVIYQRVVEVAERVRIRPDLKGSEKEIKLDSIVQGITGEYIEILQRPDMTRLESQLQELYNEGIRSVAVALVHAYTFPEHEKQIGKLAARIGFEQTSLSSEVMPMVKIVPRGYTSCADAYLTPVIKTYIQSFKSGFDSGFDKLNICFMQSDGGLTSIDRFCGHRAILSGPAGGVVGYARTTVYKGKAVIGFDMGGTSTDVSRYAGKFEHVYENITAGVAIQAPQLDIHTVAAGGGSRLFYRDGMFSVGPESAGANPGPVCYRKQGGLLAVTDANLVLGRVMPQYFPSIFGPNENQPLDTEASKRAFEALRGEIDQDYSLDEIAYGFIRVANEAMCRPIRNLTQMKGHDITKHVLATFGGAGPQHCCAIAKNLGIDTVYVHRYSGILSAYGLSLSDIVSEKQEPCALEYTENNLKIVEARLQALSATVGSELEEQGFPPKQQEMEYYLNMRYQGTDVAVMTSSSGGQTYKEAFIEQYKREFGFTLQGRGIVIDDLRVRGTGKTVSPNSTEVDAAGGSKPQGEAIATTSVYFETGRTDTPVYHLGDLLGGQVIAGPAIIMQDVATVLIEPECTAHITPTGDIRIEIGTEVDKKLKKASTKLDPIQLSIFSHRFMGLAEQMGRTLQRTSVSVNIKERLDFSCALFDPEGGLVANAPHLPVHLGSMQQAVRYQLNHWGDDLVEGDVLVSNHPQLAGGSHLPDITVITPVFNEGKIVFFVASRGHHSDIGGIAPGSMPPHSKTLEDEGAAIIAFKLVSGKDGIFQEEGITRLLQAPGLLENNFGTRNLKDNISDLKAQVAANTRGVCLMHELIKEYGISVVHSYMNYIQENAELAVRNMLFTFSESNGMDTMDTVQASDYMDDGTCIQLAITINRDTRSAVFDFAGTGPEVYGNVNAPPAVTYSAIIYCLRCLLAGYDIPLNQGCLKPIEVRLPKGCILNPSDNAAVVGGNVLTSQRVTDVILRCFSACAASQGCMNNLTFGDSTMGYYETIAGGCGAGPTWHGRSGIHTHMTNTRITDPEILERRYPVLLKEFALRPNSGGSGKFYGGDGIIRDIQFFAPLTVSILSERRVFAPYGMAGGEAGSVGLNLWVKSSGQVLNLGGKNTVEMSTGDRLRVLTPGGGGYGAVEVQEF